MRWAGSVVGLVLACGVAEDEPAKQVGEGWSGSPPVEPVEVGMQCDREWYHCVDGAYCDVVDHTAEYPYCGTLGVCVEIPMSCEPGSPRCGCDGERYDSACAAAMAGVSAIGTQGCEPPPGSINCGAEFCDIDTHYCRFIFPHGQSEERDCVPLNCADGISGCDCITDPSPCGEDVIFGAQYCEQTPEGGTLLTCVPA